MFKELKRQEEISKIFEIIKVLENKIKELEKIVKTNKKDVSQ